MDIFNKCTAFEPSQRGMHTTNIIHPETHISGNDFETRLLVKPTGQSLSSTHLDLPPYAHTCSMSEV